MVKRRRKNHQRRSKMMCIPLRSELDLVRCACRFSHNSADILVSEHTHSEGLVGYVPSETVGKCILAYTARISTGSDSLVYSYDDLSHAETIADYNPTDSAVPKTNSYRIGLTRINLSNFDTKGGMAKNGINFVRMEKHEDLIKSVIKKSLYKEELENIFIFKYKGKNVLYAFDIIESLADETHVLYYAMFDIEIEGLFARYNYSSGSVDFSNAFGEHSYMYVKLIFLADMPKFFEGALKMPE
jgi:hypothetical protein